MSKSKLSGNNVIAQVYRAAVKEFAVRQKEFKEILSHESVPEKDVLVAEWEYIKERRDNRKNRESEIGLTLAKDSKTNEEKDRGIKLDEAYRNVGAGKRPKLGMIFRAAEYPASESIRTLISELGESVDKGNLRDPGVDGTIGLALSGGGIRSASFCLGAIQGLFKYHIFENVDFMSTVSGGGYIGSSFSSLYSNHQFDFSFRHKKGKTEPSPFRYLRNHANYLLGDGNLDVFRIIAVVVRGLISNVLILTVLIIISAAIIASYLPIHFELWPFVLDQIKSLPFITGSFAVSGNVNALLAHFPVTALFLGLYLFTTVIFAGAKFPLYNTQTLNKSAHRDEADWETRNNLERLMAYFLILVLGVGVFEAHLWLIKNLAHEIRWNPDRLYSQTYSWTIGLVPFLARGFMGGTEEKLKGRIAQIGTTVMGFLGVGSVLFAFVLVAAYLHANFGADQFTDELFVLSNELLTIMGAGAIAFFFIYYTTDINLTSLHNYYRDRLSKAFLFRHVEKGKDIVDHADHLRLSDLSNPWGPYHLINAAINSEIPAEKYRKGRKADFFLFSPYYIGSESTGYCRSEDMEAIKPHVNLGTAMAISGAAVAPNAGRHVNPALRFLLALLNIRMNYWLPHPEMVRRARRLPKLNMLLQRLKPGPFYLIREMLGRTDSRDELLNISDGGHIENMGLNQLLRRKCSLIIVCDGEHDPKLQYGGFLEALRIAQIDQGVRIVMDGLDEIRLGIQSFAVGTIQYDDKTGKLLYLKSSMMGDSSLQNTLGADNFLSSQYRHDRELYDAYSYIGHYRATHPDFPHESTGDQFFGEQQFECYRALGYIVVEEALVDRPDAPSTRMLQVPGPTRA